MKQKSLATQTSVGIILIIKILALKIDLKLIDDVSIHANYPIIFMIDCLYAALSWNMR